MKIYIASRCQVAARQIRDLVQSRGHECCARWLDSENYGKAKPDSAQKAQIALEDLADVAAADVLILRSEPDGSYVPGGKHVEFGAALALGKPVIVLGAPENIFHYHPRVTVVDRAGLVGLLDVWGTR